MADGITRSILEGALAAGLVLCAPLAASAAEPAHVSLSALYEGVQVPSMATELTLSAVVGPGVPVYSEPASNGTFTHVLPRVEAIGAAKEGMRVRVSEPFTAGNEQWVAVQVPKSAHGTDTAKSTLADPGVAYMRAGSAKGPQSPKAAAAPAAETSYPTELSDLVKTADVPYETNLYASPVDDPAGVVSVTVIVHGTEFQSSEEFIHGGITWVAVNLSIPATPSGVAYLKVTEGVVITDRQPSSTPSNTPMPAATSTPSDASEVTPARADSQPNPFLEALTKWPAVLFAAMVMAATMFITKPRTA